MKKLLYILFPTFILVFSSCEDVIDIDLDEGTPQLAVDAIITNELKPQVIKLTKSIPYFQKADNFPAVDADSVYITDNNGKTFLFAPTGNGTYTFNPSGNDTFAVGNTYLLTIKAEGSTYTAASKLQPVAPIDSLTYEFSPAVFGFKAGFYVEFHAIDLLGTGNCTWVRTYRNDTLYGKPEQINVAYDAAFAPGGANDFIKFIVPIRFLAINDGDRPYIENEKVKVELLSISEDFYYFLREAQAQISNQGLFATPPANVRTNVRNTNPNGPKPVGFFCVSAISAKEVVIQ